MTRDAEMRARDFVALVRRRRAETEVGVAQRLLLQAQTALNSYADPDWACSQGWPAFADRLLELARGAEPAPITSWRSSTRCARRRCRCGTPRVLAALLDDRPAPSSAWPGSPWTPICGGASSSRWPGRRRRRRGHGDAVHRRRGAARPDRGGQAHAAAASAARPQLAVKEAAWQQVVEDDTIANITTRAIVTGFVQPGQAALLAPFTAKYFDAIAGVWERRSSEVAQTVVIGLYPSWDVSQAGLDAADRFLAGDVPPALHRLVIEGRAGVERALRARAFDIC